MNRLGIALLLVSSIALAGKLSEDIQDRLIRAGLSKSSENVADFAKRLERYRHHTTQDGIINVQLGVIRMRRLPDFDNPLSLLLDKKEFISTLAASRIEIQDECIWGDAARNNGECVKSDPDTICRVMHLILCGGKIDESFRDSAFING